MSALTVILVVICGLFAATHGQDVEASALTITSATASKVTHTMCDAAVTGLGFNMVLKEVDSGGSVAGIVTAINFYYTDNSDYGASGIVKSAAGNTATLGGDITVAADTTTGTTGDKTVDLAIDATNCASYTHLCAVITVTNDAVDTNDFSCIAIKPAIAADTFTVTSPNPASAITYTTGSAVTITFTLAVVESAGFAGSLTAINIYFTDNVQYETATSAGKSTATSATFTGSPKTITASATTTVTAATAELMLDGAKCAMYTHICAVITVTADSGVTTDDDTCIALTAVTAGAGVTSCPTIAAGTLTVTAPTLTGITYTCATATSITFSMVIAESDGNAGSLTGINLYFTNNVQYETANIVKSAAMAATVTGTPLAIPATNGVTVTGATAALTLDATNCASYTHLCAVITVASDTGGTTDDDTCIALSVTAAGVIYCSGTACQSGSVTFEAPVVLIWLMVFALNTILLK